MLKIGLRTTKNVIAVEQGSVFCEVTLTPPSPAGSGAGQAARNPVALVLCLDRSGSMGDRAGSLSQKREAGTKMSHARAAAVRMINSLRPGDQVGLVTFSTLADVEFPLTSVNEAVRADLVQLVRRIEPDSTTNIADGIGKSLALFSEDVRRNRACKIVLLSDGLANVGVSDADGLAGIARGAYSSGIAVSALGVGIDYSLEVMSGLAQAGGGEFYHISDPAEIGAVVAGEVEDIKAVTVRQAALHVQVPPMVALGTNLNLLPQHDVPDGVEIAVGDLSRPRQVIFEIATPVATGLETIHLLVACAYLNSLTGAEEKVQAGLEIRVVPYPIFLEAEVDQQLADGAGALIEAQAVRQATTAYEQGDLHHACEVLDRADASLRSPVCRAPSAAARATQLEQLRSRMSAGGLSSDEARAEHSLSYAVSTSRAKRGQEARSRRSAKEAHSK